MNRTEASPPSARQSPDHQPSAPHNYHWPHRGGTIEDLMAAAPERGPLPIPAANEIIARVEAVSICSSDVKILRLGDKHPLFSSAKTSSKPTDTVLGHEVCLRVFDVGAAMAGQYRVGQRLGLQPAMWVNGERCTIGIDVPGGFAQYLRLDQRALNEHHPHVFDLPEDLPAATLALLEPYGCVERAYRPNARQSLRAAGRALLVFGPDADRYTMENPVAYAHVTVCGAGDPSTLVEHHGDVHEVADPDALGEAVFDDIYAIGEISAAWTQQIIERMATGGLLLMARQTALNAPISIDPARVHYDALSFLGTTSSALATALDSKRQRFEVKEGGVALINGAGGAMGRIHVHRLLQLPHGPATVIATSRRRTRCQDILNDFGELARRNGRTLIAVEDTQLINAAQTHAPNGLDDAIIAAPTALAVQEAVNLLAPNGTINIFAGMPYGQAVHVPLDQIAIGNMRILGSTGCSVSDMQDVLSRISSGELDISANLKAIAGLNALPEALNVVLNGDVSGKIVVYPHAHDLPLTPIRDGAGWSVADENGLTG